jgi:hypothetical protein
MMRTRILVVVAAIVLGGLTLSEPVSAQEGYFRPVAQKSLGVGAKRCCRYVPYLHRVVCRRGFIRHWCRRD